MVFLSENTLHDEVNDDIQEVEGISFGMEPGLEAGLALEAMASDAFHVITEAVIIADAREYVLRTKAQLMEQAGNADESKALTEKADALQEGVLANMWDKIKNFFVNLWKWIVGVFNDFIKWISQWFASSKKFAEKYGDDFKKAWGALKEFKLQGYSFKTLDATINKIKTATAVIITTNKGLLSDANSMKAETDKTLRTGSGDNEIDKSKFRGNFVGGGQIEQTAFLKQLRISLYGSESPDLLKKSDFNADEIVKNVSSEANTMKALKEMRAEAGKVYNDVIKATGKIAADFKKSEDKLADTKSKIMNDHVKALRFQCSTLNTVITNALGAYRAYVTQCKSIMSHVISYTPKAKKTSESTVIEDNDNVLDKIMEQLQY